MLSVWSCVCWYCFGFAYCYVELPETGLSAKLCCRLSVGTLFGELSLNWSYSSSKRVCAYCDTGFCAGPLYFEFFWVVFFCVCLNG